MQTKTFTYALMIAGAAAIVALGSASPSFAAKKKMAKSYADQATPVCLQPQTPVCGTRGGMKFTYASACFALKDGASIIGDGACKPAKKMAKKKSMKKKM